MNTQETWLDIPKNSDFSIHNIPFGVYTTKGVDHAIAIAIGEHVLDLNTLHEAGYFGDLKLAEGIFKSEFLNPFIATGKAKTNGVRKRVQELLYKGSSLRNDLATRNKAFIRMENVTMLMPVKVGNYTDFYSSIEHATNVGTMFRDPDNALFPNWKHLPVGYHGRASSIVPSGVPIHRPKGQMKNPNADLPVFGPSKRLDFELEMAFITGKETALGDSVSTSEAPDYIFGFTLFNDWSARDIQVWEYVPLGPFLGKSFASSISPWIVTIEALEPFRTESQKQDPAVLPYLVSEGKNNFDIELEVYIQPENSEPSRVCVSNFKHLYWNVNQQLAHQTINGCNLQVGDLYASGTISGRTPSSYGSMLELAWKGTKPLTLADGSTRTFIEDGDRVIMKATAEKDGIRIGFGEVNTQVLAAK